MKITICGSVKCANKMVEIYKQLEGLKHQPQMHQDMFDIADGSAKELINEVARDHAEAKKKYNFIKIWHNLIANSDAILVCNFDKNGIKNYIGGNVLMEVGFAYVLDKKIYFYNDIPKMEYTDELKAMEPVVINGDLDRII